MEKLRTIFEYSGIEDDLRLRSRERLRREVGGNLRATKRTTTEHASLVVSGSIGRQSKGEKRSVHYSIKSARRVFESHGEKSFGND